MQCCFCINTQKQCGDTYIKAHATRSAEQRKTDEKHPRRAPQVTRKWPSNKNATVVSLYIILVYANVLFTMQIMQMQILHNTCMQMWFLQAFALCIWIWICICIWFKKRGALHAHGGQAARSPAFQFWKQGFLRIGHYRNRQKKTLIILFFRLTIRRAGFIF